MASIFTSIINGEIPCYKVAEDDKHFAFLDIFPVARGHVLVVPKVEIDRLFDLEEKDYEGLMLFARKVAKAIEQAFDCDRVGMSVVGLEVPHAHVHLIPINALSDMDLTREKLRLTPEEFGGIAQRIGSYLIL